MVWFVMNEMFNYLYSSFIVHRAVGYKTIAFLSQVMYYGLCGFMVYVEWLFVWNAVYLKSNFLYFDLIDRLKRSMISCVESET
jgi:hypothetical protein